MTDIWACYAHCSMLQVLIYPKVTATNEETLKSYQEYRDGPIVGMELIEWSVISYFYLPSTVDKTRKPS